MMIIGVTGSRTWKSREIISAAFDAAAADFLREGNPAIVIEGGAGGADELCKLEAIHRGWHPATVPALWGFYGKREAGHIRNSAMTYLGMNAACWLAFISPCAKPGCVIGEPHDSHGTANCIKAAKDMGIEVRGYRE
jgi:hypothetical protein